MYKSKSLSASAGRTTQVTEQNEKTEKVTESAHVRLYVKQTIIFTLFNDAFSATKTNFKAQYRHLPGGNEESHGKPQSG
jgi:hypothetical protein